MEKIVSVPSRGLGGFLLSAKSYLTNSNGIRFRPLARLGWVPTLMMATTLCVWQGFRPLSRLR